MATTPLNTIKNWFKTGLKPTQAQFWATLDSLRHKDEAIPIAAIENLQEELDSKADSVAMGLVKIDGLWFDTHGNQDRFAIEVGNTFDGWDGDYRISGKVTVLPFDVSDRATFKQSIRNKAI